MPNQQKRISEWRAVRGMSQQQLADVIGVKPQQVSQWETGHRGIAARRLRDVARALDVSMDDIELPGEGTTNDRP
jgi:transcriptional regulator with XRE-family HTH domain